MMLRRLMVHIKDQNWLAVWLDFLIVVLGVFIGVQVSNWNNDREVAIRQQEILTEMIADLQADMAELEDVQRYNEMRYSAAETILNRVTGWRLADQYPEDFDNKMNGVIKPQVLVPPSASKALYFALRYRRFHIHQESYEALLNSGELTLAGQPDLLSAIKQHYAFAATMRQHEDRRQLPFAETVAEAFSAKGLVALDTVDWQQLEGLVEDDVRLQGLLKQVVWEAVIQYEMLQYVKASTEELIVRLEALP